MKESISEDKKNVDPTKFSPISENLNLRLSSKTHKEKYKLNGITTPVEIPVWVDTDGNEYFQKMPELKPHKQDLPVEHFISMLIKGALNSSDLVKHVEKDGTIIYLSKKMDLGEIEGGSPEEIKAEIFLLNYLFEEMDKTSTGQNVAISPDTGAFVHYDYSEGFRSKKDDPTFWYEQNQNAESLIPGIIYQLDNIYKYEIAPKGRPTKLPDNNTPSKGVELVVKNKALMLREQIQDLEFFKAVIKKSNIDLSENSARFHFLNPGSEEERALELQKMILDRLNVLINVLELRK